MADLSFDPMLSVVLALIISTIAIYLVGKVAGEADALTAFLAAIVGTFLYVVIYHYLGIGLLAAAVAGLFWFLMLKAMYKIGWTKAMLTAVLIWLLNGALVWFLASYIGVSVPTLTAPF